ncbi:hypothetical protein CH276_02165 [Rhodococcus sp. 06-470-2]|nr:hypothetical protein CH276_02165 [Rhodococcus sp. 06-470-2]OZE59746.1 hypothetical protein CH265_20465 [Rhodococcus sp. 05-2221-1B]
MQALALGPSFPSFLLVEPVLIPTLDTLLGCGLTRPVDLVIIVLSGDDTSTTQAHQGRPKRRISDLNGDDPHFFFGEKT